MRRGLYILFGLLALFIAWVGMVLPQHIPSGQDAGEAAGIVSALKSRYTFRVLTKGGNRPAVYCKPHPKYSKILVYGDYSTTEQDEICAVARAVRREVAKKPVHLYFYPRELVNSGLMRKQVFE